MLKNFSFDLYTSVEFETIYWSLVIFFEHLTLVFHVCYILVPHGTSYFRLLYECLFNLPPLTRSSPLLSLFEHYEGYSCREANRYL